MWIERNAKRNSMHKKKYNDKNLGNWVNCDIIYIYAFLFVMNLMESDMVIHHSFYSQIYFRLGGLLLYIRYWDIPEKKFVRHEFNYIHLKWPN